MKQQMSSNPNSTDSDDEIRARLASNDSSALDMIWDAYSSDLLGYLVSILCSRHDAEDTLQEVFITIAKKRSSVAKARLLKPYIFRLARNSALNLIKKNSRKRDREHKAADWLVISGEGENRDERTNHAEMALAALPEKQRSVVVLKFYQSKTFRKIGEMLGISENTAASRYRYGIRKLKDLMLEEST